jgi:hypothetical protein
MLAHEASPAATAERNPPAPPSPPNAAELAAAARPKRRIPSYRNRRIYEQVVLRERPQSEVAKEFRITQQRVSQIVDHFHAWLKGNLPPEAEEYNAQEQLTLAASNAYLRQEHLFGEAMRRLEQSGKERVVLKTRYSKTGEELGTHTTRYLGSPNSGFINAALKATTQQWKLAQMAHGLLGRAMEIQFWLPHEYEDQTLCGAEPVAAPTAAAGAAKPAATAAAATGCDPQAPADASPPAAPQGCAKSCERPPEDHKGQAPKVLWPAGEPASAEATATRPAAASNVAPATACDRGTRPAPPSQGPTNPCAKSCETPDVMTEALVTDSVWAEMLSTAADRRARKKERKKQLARWQAKRKAG